jgi:uncharacterized protein (UPF0147 family)
MKKTTFLALFLLIFLNFALGETSDEKLRAYSMIVETLSKLESQLELINKSITVAEEKIQKTSSLAVKNLFKSQLEKLEDQKELVEGRAKKLTSVLEELKNDPEIGSLIESQEATRAIKQKLDKVSSTLSDITN